MTNNDDLLHIDSVVSDLRCQIYLRGEADIFVVTELTAALDAIGIHPGQGIHVDVAELRFIDLSCLRALIRFASQAQQVGVAVQVERPNGIFKMMHRMIDPGVLHMTDAREECRRSST